MISVYLHIPFCQRKCLYCDFYSIEAVGMVEAFLNALSREVALAATARSGEEISTVYFGGGTPSLLPPEQIGSVLDNIRRHWLIRPDAEITLEANPGTLTDETLQGLRRVGVNRLSLGVQSFHDPLLRSLGRIHDRAEALRAVEMARAAGFANLSLDFIYAIPGETVADWEEDLCTAIGLAPQHISAYGLTIERHTPLGRMVTAGEVRPAPTELEAAMLERTMELLAGAGYEHYEVSNYARPGFSCRHNLAYWSHQDYLGFGPSAHSFRLDQPWAHARRWWNVADLDAYCRRLAAGLAPEESKERLGGKELFEERALLELRTGHLDLGRLTQDFGLDLEATRTEALQSLSEKGLIVLRDGILDLTPRGFLLCDEICLRLTT